MLEGLRVLFFFSQCSHVSMASVRNSGKCVASGVYGICRKRFELNLEGALSEKGIKSPGEKL